MNLKAHSQDACILIIDDAEDNIALLTRILEIAGYRNIHSTSDPCKAADLFAQLRPHAVLLDLNMPIMNGFDVMEKIQQSQDIPYIPILMITADSDRETKLRALESGAKDFLTKPFDRLEVVIRINTIIEVSQLHERLSEHNQQLQEEVLEQNRALQIEMRNRIQIEELAKHQSLHDTLTGLPNRILLNDRLQQAIYTAERNERCVGVLLVNLDRFEEINNTLGHCNGDEILQQVAKRLSNSLRRGDTVARIDEHYDSEMVARLDGDEFALILPMLSSSEETIVVAQRVLSVFNEPFPLGDLKLDVSARVSIVNYPEHGVSTETLLQHADVAMYAAKRKRESYLVYNAEMDQFCTTRLTLMSELRSAISNNELELYFQPKIDLARGTIIGFEALVRWMHKDRGFIPPDEFIPMAEETGVIGQLSTWVIRTACKQCADFTNNGYPLSISINLSVSDLLNTDLSEMVSSTLREHGVPAERIMLEVTESAMMHDPDQALRVISDINRMGIDFSIDDFGTGYSSLAYLKKLPVSEVKIDRSFVRDMEKDSDDAIIVNSTIDLAHNLGLKVVAEGIENEAILDLLNQQGCDIGQGYHMARPLSVQQAYAWLEESSWALQAKTGAVKIGS